MKKLIWWWMFCTIIAGAAVGIHLGGLHFLWAADQTKITFFMLAAFVGLTGYIGWLTLTRRKSYDLQPALPVDALWFGADALMRLGILTTVTGFMMMFTGALGHFGGDPASMQAMLLSLAHGLMTSLTGTFVGIATSMLAGLQIINLTHEA